MIIFKKISIRNFLSIGNTDIEINLNSCKLKAFSGISGAGKSIILDALSFVLFNKAYRSIKKGQLINSINSKDLFVKVWFSIGSDEYIVSRGIKSDIYEISKNNSMLNIENTASNQDLLESILGMNAKTFKQIVVLGASDFTSFMNLKPVDRRILIEKLLDIEVFAYMNKNIQEDIKVNKSEYSSLETKIEIIESKIESINQNILSIEKQKSTILKNNDEEIKKYEDKILEYQSKIVNLTEDCSKDILKYEKMISELNSKRLSIGMSIDQLEVTKKFYNETTVCNTCKQELNEQLKTSVLNDCEENLKKHQKNFDKILLAKEKVNEKLKILNSKYKIYKDNKEKNASYTSAIETLNTKIEYLNRPVDNVFDERMQELEKDLIIKEKELKKAKSDLDKTAIEKEVLLSAKNLVGDSGVKTYIINQYVPLINKYMNVYLNAMDFFVTFEIDSEFNESIKSRGRDVFSYSSFSEGEKQRIDLAMLLTWRKISQAKNSLATNLLILDEVFDSYLNVEATENVIEMFRNNFDNNTNIIVISHKESILDKFEEVIFFKKDDNFTQISK